MGIVPPVTTALTERSRPPRCKDEAARRCRWINERLEIPGLFTRRPRFVPTASRAGFRIAPEPVALPPGLLADLEALGGHLLAFTRGVNLAYRELPAVRELLDRGKPPEVTALSREARWREAVPPVIRPDVIPTEDGYVITELDSVPGGIGLTGHLADLYEQMGCPVAAGARGMVEGFRRAVGAEDGRLTIALSEEAADYREEMRWWVSRMREDGVDAELVPAETVSPAAGMVYRFFELFDLPNLPGARRVLEAAREGAITVTPPPKAPLEEKAAFALYHDPALAGFWRDALPGETRRVLDRVLPDTWVLDPAAAPPAALSAGGKPVRSWTDLGRATQRERELVVKPSGFSPLAWGARGVTIGHDQPAAGWKRALTRALEAFPRTPHVLQRFHKGRRTAADYYDFPEGGVRRMTGRARVCPYYFVENWEEGGTSVRLGGVLVTLCPLDKKILHGMSVAIIAPAAGHGGDHGE